MDNIRLMSNSTRPQADRGGSSSTSGHTRKMKAFTAVTVLALALTLALVAAVVVPRLLHRS